MAAEAQEKRRNKDLWEDLIDEMTYAGTALNSAVIHLVDGQERVATSDILENVLQIPPAQRNRNHAMRLPDVMKRLGWQRDGENKITIKGKQVRGYYRQAGMAPVQTVTIVSEGEDTTVADEIKTAGFEVASHREFYIPGKNDDRTESTLIKLTKGVPPSLSPELLARIRSTPGGGLSKDPLDN